MTRGDADLPTVAALLEAGEFAAAEAALRRIVAADAPEPDAVVQLAVLCAQSGRIEEARGLLERAVRASPAGPDAWGFLGNVSQMLGRPEEARDAYHRALALAPGDVLSLRNLAELDLSTGAAEAAIRGFRQVASQRPDDPKSHYDLGRAARADGALDAAASHYLQALALESGYLDARNELGMVRRLELRWDEAIEEFRQALALEPDFVPALANLGTLLVELGRADEALPALRRAAALAPDDARMHANLGGALSQAGDEDEAMAVLERAIAIDGALLGARWNRGLLLFLAGRWEEAWREHEVGIECGERRCRLRALPRWNGEALGGRSLLVLGEQGIGDEIMFAAYLPALLANAGPARCVVEGDPRLAPLLERSMDGLVLAPDVACPDGDRLSGMPPPDFQVPIGSLPYRLGLGGTSPSRGEAYLRADPEAAARWREALAPAGPRARIGISWRGGLHAMSRQSRSTALDEWRRLLDDDDVHAVDVQYGSSADETAAFRAATGIGLQSFESLDPMIDLDGFAALLSELDLVITVDNSTAHLAGALGVPVWTLLPAVPDWRWTREGERTHWYASMRLFRQARVGAWTPVLERVASELRQWLAGRAT